MSTMRHYIDMVSESLDTAPAKWRWIEKDNNPMRPGCWTAEFSINPMVYAVHFEPPENEDLSIPDDKFVVSFTARQRGDKPEAATVDATGTGNAFTVYATVLDVGRAFLRTHPVRILMFISNIAERSREQINQRLAEKIAAEGGFTVHQELDNIILTKN